MITVINVAGVKGPERAGVCYVGRAFAGWPASPLANRFKGPGAVERFTEWLNGHPQRFQLLAEVWEACGRGVRPLGCWCVRRPWVVNRSDSFHCHAQVIAAQLAELIDAGTLPPPAG